jgi:hypothetical protein
MWYLLVVPEGRGALISPTMAGQACANEGGWELKIDSLCSLGADRIENTASSGSLLRAYVA